MPSLLAFAMLPVAAISMLTGFLPLPVAASETRAEVPISLDVERKHV